MYKRIIGGVLLGLLLSVFTIYFLYFNRPGTAETLAANNAKNQVYDTDAIIQQAVAAGVDEEEARIIARQHERWNFFLKSNGYVSIGSLYDKCIGADRLLLGQVVMLPDLVEGGVTSKTYLNLTFAEDVVDGEMFIEVYYNSRELYANHWPLCEVENGFPDRVIYCPVKSGRQRYIKELKIPNYLPKGHYEVKAWTTNQDDKMIGCAFSEFFL